MSSLRAALGGPGRSFVRGLSVAAALALTGASADARGGDFDGQGNYVPDAARVASLDFEGAFDPMTGRYVPAGTPLECALPSFAQAFATDALDGETVMVVNTNILGGCAERFVVEVPAVRASYRATLWIRHGSVDAQMTVVFPEDSGRELVVAKMAPTGRVTSDGWVELASNPFPIDGVAAEAVYLRVYDYDDFGSEIDALELVPAGDYVEERPCAGVGDPVCGDDQICVHRSCRIGGLYVPPLPDVRIRDEMVDVMQSQLRVFFGGRKTRLSDLPLALAELDRIRKAESAWAFWNGWATSVRLLQDWHTRASGPIAGIDGDKRLNACFIQGDGDLTSAAWPKHPSYPDVLVSHTGTEGTQGLAQGDRLVAVDGLHPLEWALALVDVDWGYWQANDDAVYAELAERMRGSLLRYATHFDVLHCDAATGACDDTPTRYVVAALPDEQGPNVRCDNRPVYHFPTDSNPPANHQVGFAFYQGRIRELPVEDKVYGLLWDTLFGGGDPNGFVNSGLRNAFAFFKTNARGVILDHRAGNGGTLDGAETATHLVRPPETVLVFSSPIELGGWNGPETQSEGVAFFEALKNVAPMVAGSNSYDPDMPVALVIHRDGSASDFFPFAIKGASDKVKIFGPAPTAGAFSTFYEMEYWGGISYALASGDSIAADGTTLIGRGAEPDVIVQQRQSDLLQGRDTIHDAAVAWVLTELKP